MREQFSLYHEIRSRESQEYISEAHAVVDARLDFNEEKRREENRRKEENVRNEEENEWRRNEEREERARERRSRIMTENQSFDDDARGRKCPREISCDDDSIDTIILTFN